MEQAKSRIVIDDFGGLVSNRGPFVAKPGDAKVLTNLRCIRPGVLETRNGWRLVYWGGPGPQAAPASSSSAPSSSGGSSGSTGSSSSEPSSSSSSNVNPCLQHPTCSPVPTLVTRFFKPRLDLGGTQAGADALNGTFVLSAGPGNGADTSEGCEFISANFSVQGAGSKTHYYKVEVTEMPVVGNSCGLRIVMSLWNTLCGYPLVWWYYTGSGSRVDLQYYDLTFGDQLAYFGLGQCLFSIYGDSSFPYGVGHPYSISF